MTLRDARDPLPSVSVVIPTYNRATVVRQTLRQLRALDYPDELVDIIVVDNSTDDTPDMVRDEASAPGSSIRLIDDSPPLPAIKRNIGLRASEADLVWFINDDVWFAPDALREHVATHRSSGRPVAVLGRCEQSRQMPWSPFIEFYEPFAYEQMSRYEDRAAPYRFFWSMNLTMPRQVMLDRNLLFHEDWRHIGHEDVELGYRWMAAGYEAVYNPRAGGEHYHPHTVASASRLQVSIGRGLRDLEALIPDPDLLERYGVLHRHASLRHIVRGVLRTLLINPATAPRLVAWLDSRTERTRLTDALVWKVLMHHVNVGYRDEQPRAVKARPLIGGVAS